MAWIGYNTQSQLEGLCGLSFSQNSEPTLTQVEIYNQQIKAEIDAVLGSLEIDSITQTSDINWLAFLNNIGSGALIESIRYMNANPSESKKSSFWQTLYEKKLKALKNGEITLKANNTHIPWSTTSDPSLYQQTICLPIVDEPFFSMEDNW